jgi:hypothetical protein
MPAATRAELAKMVALLMPSPLFLGGRPRLRLAAGECGAKVALRCSTWAVPEVPASSGACKQRQVGKMVPTNLNYYHKDQSQTTILFKIKQKGLNSNDYVQQSSIRYQPTCLVHLKYDARLKSRDIFIIVR